MVGPGHQEGRRPKRIALAGYLATLAVLWIALGIAACQPNPLLRGKTEDLWTYALEREPPSEFAGKVIPIVLLPQSEYCFFTVSADPYHPWRGVILVGVKEQEALAAFPGVLKEQLALDGDSGLSSLKLGALLGRDVKDPEKAKAEVADRKEELGGSRKAMRRFIRASQDELDSRGDIKARTDARKLRARAELVLDDWLSRYDRYWMTVLFEYFLFTLLATLFWLPLVYKGVRRLLPLLWGLWPGTAALPHALGYCWLAGAFVETRGQGILYPRLVDLLFPLFRMASDLDGKIMHFLPKPLEFLNQPAMNPGLYLYSIMGPTGALALGLLIWVTVCGIRKLWGKRDGTS